MTTLVSCSPPAQRNDLVSCSLGNPYKNKSLETLKLRFAATSLGDIESMLEFRVWANSTSHEDEELNNADKIIVTVIKKAELGIYGYAELN